MVPARIHPKPGREYLETAVMIQAKARRRMTLRPNKLADRVRHRTSPELCLNSRATSWCWGATGDLSCARRTSRTPNSGPYRCELDLILRPSIWKLGSMTRTKMTWRSGSFQMGCSHELDRLIYPTS